MSFCFVCSPKNWVCWLKTAALHSLSWSNEQNKEENDIQSTDYHQWSQTIVKCATTKQMTQELCSFQSLTDKKSMEHILFFVLCSPYFKPLQHTKLLTSLSHMISYQTWNITDCDKHSVSTKEQKNQKQHKFHCFPSTFTDLTSLLSNESFTPAQ